MPAAVPVCPLCRAAASASGCRTCALPASDMVVLGGRQRTRRAAAVTRRLLVALVGYGAITAWVAWKLPDLLTFVGPAAVAAVLLHAVKNRPLVAAVVFFLVVVVLPPVLAPSLATSWWPDLRN